MATAPNASSNHEASNAVKTLDSALWWHSFSLLLTELENASLSSDLPPPLENKLKDNHAWLLDTVTMFKPPDQKSREALGSKQLKIGSHHLIIQPDLKEAALKISSVLCLNEVQSYILVERSVERKTIATDSIRHELLHLVMVQYYIERQCLLKCARQILMHALFVGSRSKESHAVWEEAQKLISDGLEGRLLSVLEVLFSSTYPEQMDVDLYTMWAEETLIEDNLVLDILFLAYYECFSTCNGKHWKKLILLYEGAISGSFNLGKLAISAEATRLVYCAKVQLLLILIETLDLENLLQMIHDEIPFRQGSVAFSLVDVQEMDAIVSGIDAFQTKEAGPLVLAWAVFLCLVSSLPEKDDNYVLMEMDHVNYVRQAIEAASLSYFLEILESNILKESDGPIAGYRSVLRTFISAFVASYEISLQLEDNNLRLILDILCKIYRGEESLCSQFWDRESFVDGPIRCLLCNLEGEFPFRAVEFVRLLSALCEGAWPAECVYNFLDKSVGLSSLFEISSDSVVDGSSKIIETHLSLHVPGVEGLMIPRGTRGQIIRMTDRNIALVRWEYTQSGVVVLLLRMAQQLYLESSKEVLVTLDLLSRLVTFSLGVCNAVMLTGKFSCEVTSVEGQQEEYGGVNVVEMICTLVKNLPPTCDGAAVMSMAVNILARMLKCSPYNVTTLTVKANIFDVASRRNPYDNISNGLSSESWLLSGRLAKMLLIDCEQNDCSLTLSVLDFTIQLVQRGVENQVVLALVVFSLQYVLVNHEIWTYKVKHTRWKVTLKVLEVVKECILSISYCKKLGAIIQDILLSDSSIHNALFQIVCTTTQGLEKLYISRIYELTDIEGVQLAISSGLDILFSMLSVLSKDLTNLSVFHQTILSPTTKPIPVVNAGISLISFFQNSKIQVSAARLLSMLFAAGDSSKSFAFANACLGLDDKQICEFRSSICSILNEQSLWNEELIIATFRLLTSAACYQPAFLAAVITSEENSKAQLHNIPSQKHPDKADIGLMKLKEKNLLNAILHYVRSSDDLMKQKPNILLNVLNFLKALWEGAPQFTNFLEQLKNSEKFWRHISDSVMLISNKPDNPSPNPTETELRNLALKYYCQSDLLEIIAYEIFLHKKSLHVELVMKETSELPKDRVDKLDGSKSVKDGICGLKDLLSTWSEGPLLEYLIKSYASCLYDCRMHLRAKISASLFSVYAMGKLKSGDMGSLSVSLVEEILVLSEKLINLPGFSELLTRYTQHGYSRGEEVQQLILSDLFYHLEGELEGRQIDDRSFKELIQYLLQSKVLQKYLCKCHEDLEFLIKDVNLYDLGRLESDIGLELWDLLPEWKASKTVAEKLLRCLDNENEMVLLTNSKLSALKALVAMLSLYSDDSTENGDTKGGKISEHLSLSCIDYTCQCLHATIESLSPDIDVSQDVVDILAAQAELLLHLIQSIGEKLSLRSFVLVLKTSGQGLKVLSGCRPSDTGVKGSTNLLLMLVLFSVKFGCIGKHLGAGTATDCVVDSAEASNVILGLLPILCQCTQSPDHYKLSLTTVDIILRGFSTPATWFPIIQKHLQLHYIVHKLQDKNSVAAIPVILQFFLTLSRVKEGAMMLVNTGFLASLRFSELSDDQPSSVVQSERSLSNAFDKTEKPRHIWGLSLAVVTAIIHSLGDSSSSTGIVDYVVAHILIEKAFLFSYYLSAPDFPSDDHDKKRARSLKRNTTLSTLKETEQTLLLICVLAGHRNSWNKAMKEMDSKLRERSIHLLAFISRGTQRQADLPGRVAPLLCHPVLKEEFEWYKKPSFINSRNGWFVLSALGCGLDPNFSSLSSKTTALVIKDQSNDNADAATYFSDVTAVQIYKISFLLLKFLCIQAEGAAKRAEEVGFVDLAHFPELPMPDILHSLQDQGIIIVNELCEANKLKQAAHEMQDICLLLLQITIMALYLELCVIQICGMRPVLGRAEDFLKEIRLLVRATERHAFLKETVKSLKQIVSFVYPESQAETLI